MVKLFVGVQGSVDPISKPESLQLNRHSLLHSSILPKSKMYFWRDISTKIPCSRQSQTGNRLSTPKQLVFGSLLPTKPLETTGSCYPDNLLLLEPQVEIHQDLSLHHHLAGHMTSRSSMKSSECFYLDGFRTAFIGFIRFLYLVSIWFSPR